ncbi:hypothetical protein PQD73_gp095 [Stenotrophomonas phage Salva]|uniref:Uncharacterized protein n=1 Tax=Stenotrophomonas phage Salva TaxID=2801524 RepID=A0A8B6Q889_9CAUD|nr:hypothetical protein PQD73_gp095 [Stenotrophomonas phage Salva]QQM18244.1 hypothetical protein CPT_Salva_081 [Stenotrophomonas phage Salva]
MMARAIKEIVDYDKRFQSSTPVGTVRKGSRSWQIIELLKKHGPMTCAQVLQVWETESEYRKVNTYLRNSTIGGAVICTRVPSDNRYGFESVYHLDDHKVNGTRWSKPPVHTKRTKGAKIDAIEQELRHGICTCAQDEGRDDQGIRSFGGDVAVASRPDAYLEDQVGRQGARKGVYAECLSCAIRRSCEPDGPAVRRHGGAPGHDLVIGETMSRTDTLRRKYVRKVVLAILAEGYFITVNNGSFRVCDRNNGITPLLEAMFSTDGDRLEVFPSADKRAHPRPLGWVEFTYLGNFTEMIADYSPTLECFIKDIDERLQREVITDRRKA